jgi:hypothetical protein
MKKKLQIFVSSTFTDLLDERQAAVQAILRAGNIPAGMELFSAGNKSQLDTIKKWIEESDIYMLILGGRYGTLESDSQMSYTEIEYRYALELEKPLFAVVLNEEFIENKVKIKGANVLELDYQDKYKEFRTFVLSKVCRLCKDENEIKLSILESIIDIQDQFVLTGWIKGDEIPDNSILLNELEALRTERNELQKKVVTLETLTKKTTENDLIGDFSFDDINATLTSNIITIPENISAKGVKTDVTALELFTSSSGILTKGVTNYRSSINELFLINTLVPMLLNFGLMGRHTISTSYDKYIISTLGNKFLSIFQLRNAKKTAPASANL